MIDQNDVSEMLKVLQKDHIPFEFEKLRDRLAIFLDEYRQLPQQEQIAIRAQVRPLHGAKLLRSAQELAVRAVRTNKIDDVELGLLAVALEGVQWDFRSTVVSLCLLHHSAAKLGFDPAPLFRQVAAFGTAEAQEFIVGYLQRGDKNIRAFAFEEEYGPDGFDYVVINI